MHKKMLLRKYESYLFVFIGLVYLVYRFMMTKVRYEFIIACAIGIVWGVSFVFLIKKFKNMSASLKFLLSPFIGTLLMTQILPPSEISIFLMASLVTIFLSFPSLKQKFH